MNILVLMTDQLSFRTIRAYGGASAFPAIDSLFERGATVDQVYTPCPLCLPARASFWTSRLPHRTGALSNGRAFENRTITPDTPTLGSLFDGAGWECVHFGKEHDAGGLRGFERMPMGETAVDPAYGYPVNADTFRDRFTSDQVVDWFAARSRSTSGHPPLLAVIDLLNPHNICGWVGEMARHVLGREADVVPSALKAPSYEPTPGFPPERPTEALPELPPNFRDTDFQTRPRSVQYQCCAHNRLAQTQGWREREFRLYLDAYRHYTGLVDDEIARILRSAEKAIDLGETYIVFTSDHGDAIAAHSAATKHTTFYEETTRVPFCVVGPDIPAGGRVTGPTSLLDLVPTLLDLAGLSKRPEVVSATAEMDGESIASALKAAPSDREETVASPVSAAPRYVVSEWHTEWGFTIEPGRMITNGRYKLMRYAEGRDEEFYDLALDPYETRNLIPDTDGTTTADEHSDPKISAERSAAVNLLRAELDAHLARSSDPFESLEASAEARWRSHAPGYHNHVGVAAPEYVE